ncbi:MAG: maleylpyruvate isomerase family mycothiol-dependent enzyme [Acidimicrobiia bacterium]|nr:maleylpyruvate isomerase family mycothiol-dependent enzyme [Acidimicrobiia bacterium]
MDCSEYLTAIRRDSDALAAAADRGLDQVVPSCPGWTVRDVVQHTGAVHRQKEQIVRERWMETQPDRIDPPPAGLVEWFLSGAELLLNTLATTDPAVHVYSWYPPDQSVGFWYRRMAHETAIHRVDAELGHRIVCPLDSALAADGVDEILTVMMEGYPDWATSAATDQTLEIECNDRPGSWSMRFITWTGTGPESGTSHNDEPGIAFESVDDPTTIVRGTAGDLDLFLWGRGPKDRLIVDGDPSLVDTLRAIAAEATA